MEETFGKYVLLSRLGYGGMAEVFLARTDGIGGFAKLLAIKRLLPYYTEDEQTVELLADEANITVRLTHPNIVQVFDFGRVDDHYYIAMEYVEGLDLKSLVEIDEYTSEPLPIDVALFVVISVLEALDYAHNRTGEDGEPLKIIHRDVSPQNVLISRHGQVKLTDFGVARAAISSHVSMIGDIRGKFSYMPPEQACGGDIDHRIDVFAAGAVLYELLTGKQPFRSTSSGQQMELLYKSIATPSELRPEIPPALDEITLRSLALSADDRFADAAVFARALGEHITARGDPRGPKKQLAELVDRKLQFLAGHDAQIDHFAPLGRAELASANAPSPGHRAPTELSPVNTSNHLPPAPIEDGFAADPTVETKLAIPVPRGENRAPMGDNVANGEETLLDQPPPPQSSSGPIGMAPTQLMDEPAVIVPIDSLEVQETVIKRPKLEVAGAKQQDHAPVQDQSWDPHPQDFPSRWPVPPSARFPVRVDPPAAERPERAVDRALAAASEQLSAQHAPPEPEPKRSSAVLLSLFVGGLILVIVVGVLLAVWVATA